MKVNPLQVRQSYVIGVVAAVVKDWELVIRKEVTFGALPQEFAVIDSANRHRIPRRLNYRRT